MLTKMARDPSIKRLIYDRIVHETRMTQWHIWDLGIVYRDCLGQQIVCGGGPLVQALLEDKQFLGGRTAMSLIKILSRKFSIS